jgi:hypothetical protein
LVMNPCATSNFRTRSPTENTAISDYSNILHKVAAVDK